MNWFKHDSNASTDAKIKKLILKYGTDGYAISTRPQTLTSPKNPC